MEEEKLEKKSFFSYSSWSQLEKEPLSSCLVVNASFSSNILSKSFFRPLETKVSSPLKYFLQQKRKKKSNEAVPSTMDSLLSANDAMRKNVTKN